MLTPREELETHTKPHTFIHTHTQSTTQNPHYMPKQSNQYRQNFLIAI